MLDIRSISKPCNAVHVGTPSVLPLKPVPEVDCSHDICIERVHKLADAVVKEPVSNGRVVGNCLLRLELLSFFSGQMRRASSGHWPSAEHSGHSQCVHHGDQPAPLLEPELVGPSKAAGKVHHSMGEEFPLVAHHVMMIV